MNNENTILLGASTLKKLSDEKKLRKKDPHGIIFFVNFVNHFTVALTSMAFVQDTYARVSIGDSYLSECFFFWLDQKGQEL